MPGLRPLTVFAAALGALLVACPAADDAQTSSDDVTSGVTRNFDTHPAILEIKDADQIYALSDPHGAYEPLVKLLAANGLVAGMATDPTKVKWSGGTATLVIVGDLIDKGPKPLEVIDVIRSLEEQALRAGGRVVTTMGNHEAEFFVDARNKKAMSTGQDATGIDQELAARNIDPDQLAAGKDPEGRGRWLSRLPLGVRVKKWFFAHAGNTQRLSIKQLEDKLSDSLTHHGFDDKDITGDDSILESQQWYGDYDDKNAGEKEADALGVSHIVFGHDPGAFKEHGKIRSSSNGILVKLDVAMGLHEASGINEGALLHVWTVGTDAAEVLDAHGKATKLEAP